MDVIREYLSAGGWMMYVILSMSIIGVMLFLERCYGLFLRQRLSARAFIRQIVNHVENRRFRDALDMCEVSTKHPLANVMKAGLLRANRPAEEIERAMENEMLAALPDVQKRVAVMGLLGNISTLLGLLGTIFGLIAAFTAVGGDMGNAQQALAAGISKAMYTTAFGISVAVPLLFFHHILSNRMDRILVETEGGATSLLVALTGVVREMRPPESSRADGSLESPARSAG